MWTDQLTGISAECWVTSHCCETRNNHLLEASLKSSSFWTTFSTTKLLRCEPHSMTYVGRKHRTRFSFMFRHHSVVKLIDSSWCIEILYVSGAQRLSSVLLNGRKQGRQFKIVNDFCAKAQSFINAWRHLCQLWKSEVTAMFFRTVYSLYLIELSDWLIANYFLSSWPYYYKFPSRINYCIRLRMVPLPVRPRPWILGSEWILKRLKKWTRHSCL